MKNDPTNDGGTRAATGAEAHWFEDYAHDVRTPLGIINGNIEMLADPMATAMHRFKALKAIVMATSRLHGISTVMLFDQIVREGINAETK